MHLAVWLVAAALVQAGWKVEESPLVEPGWDVRDTGALNDDTVAAIGVRDPRDGGAITSAVFIAHVGEAPRLLGRFPGAAEDATGKGTGFTVETTLPDAGLELLRVRPGPEPALVSLGVFKDRVKAVSCDEKVTDCGIVTAEGAALRWNAGARTMLTEGEAWGIAMRERGGAVAIGLSFDAAIMTFEPSKVWLLRGAMTQMGPGIEAIEERIAKSPALAAKWQAQQDCVATPQGWNGDRLHVTLGGTQDIGAPDCLARPSDFELELASNKRTALPPYPWQPLDCPMGGWTSRLGTFVTQCDTVQDMMRPGRGRGRREVPEAVALSEKQIFVMAAPEPADYFWYPGPPNGRGLKFVVDGPSVITFKPKGVTVEKIDWRFGNARFGDSLAGDWHLITPPKEPPALVRLAPAP
jgi:hypothetical protein